MAEPVRKVLVLGAGGIVGQYLRLHQPPGYVVEYVRREAVLYFKGADLRTNGDVDALLDRFQPDVVVNLAGENRPDVVERDPLETSLINTYVPLLLGSWCDRHGAHLIQVSTQGVFGGTQPPYQATRRSVLRRHDAPVNEYGHQKLAAEQWLELYCERWTVIRLTFVLGVRPLPHVGRTNPVEDMLDKLRHLEPQRQVGDRFFSPCFAADAARLLWQCVKHPRPGRVLHCGTPVRTSRYEIASRLRGIVQAKDVLVGEVEPAKHHDFVGIAERPVDTTYTDDAWHCTEDLDRGLRECARAWRERMMWGSLEDRADELAMFLGIDREACLARLRQGFGPLHAAVAEDWRAANPTTPEAILSWYVRTPAYVWELSAYHLDPGFNYEGMCDGIAAHLAGASARDVLCLGDGIGDLTIRLHERGLAPIYHDLAESVTSDFAMFRSARRLRHQRFPVPPRTWFTDSWTPPTAPYQVQVDAVVALDFFEHLPNVEEWAAFVAQVLRPGGWFLAQNAFNIGSGPEGSIPCHLASNDHWEKDWDSLLERLGLVRSDPWNGWWRKP